MSISTSDPTSGPDFSNPFDDPWGNSDVEESVAQRLWHQYAPSSKRVVLIAMTWGVVAFSYPIYIDPRSAFLSGFLILPIVHLLLSLPALRFRSWLRRTGRAKDLALVPMDEAEFGRLLHRHFWRATIMTTGFALVAALAAHGLHPEICAKVYRRTQNIYLVLIAASALLLVTFQWVVYWSMICHLRVLVVTLPVCCAITWLCFEYLPYPSSTLPPRSHLLIATYIMGWVAKNIFIWWIAGYLLFRHAARNYVRQLTA